MNQIRENSCNSCLCTLPIQIIAPSSPIEPQKSQLETPPPILDFVASDNTIDRYAEIIDPAGWQLDNYRRNPVFQNSHQYGDILFTLGKALITEVRNGKLFQRIQFATEVNPMARIAYGLYQAKFLNAVSVGFVPLRWEDGAANASYRRKYLEQELLEVSAVGIPANPNALQLGLKSGAVAREDLRELADLLKCATSSNKTTDPIQSLNAPQLLHFAKNIRDVLRG
jgi:HK97 family phage prohead protease